MQGREEGPSADDSVEQEEEGTLAVSTAAAANAPGSQDTWEHWLETVMTGSEEDGQQQQEQLQLQATVPNLEAYLMAKQTRHEAKQAFEDAMEESLNGLNQAMTVELIQDTVAVVDQQQSERLDELETNILLTLQSNHERRQYLLQVLEQINTQWGHQYKKMRRGILNEQGSSPDQQEEKTDAKDHHHQPEAQQGPTDEVRGQGPSISLHRMMACCS